MTRPTIRLMGALTLVILGHGVAAEPVARIQVSDIRPLLTRAIEEGSAQGVLAGEAATYVRRKFDATAPIEIDVRALHTLLQAGCSRLEVTTRQRDVLEQGKRGDQALTYQVSFCRDGRFPEKH